MSKKAALILCVVLCFGLVSSAFAQLDVSPPVSIDLLPPSGQTRTIEITISGNSGTIEAYGFTLTYPTGLLAFVGTSTSGTLTDGWNSTSGVEQSPGVVVIGGFETTPPGGFTTASGTLVKVTFTDNGVPGPGQITLSNFSDDISGASSTPGTINSSVPVELVSFSAEISAGEVSLTWNTSSERNNFGFEVEKSFDEENFSKIGFLAGHGTTVQPNEYRFTDSDINSAQKTRYYRLKQIDLDGSFNYSGVLTVQLAAPESFTLQQNYPNPFNPQTTISYELPEPSRVSVVIYNMTGQVIRTLIDQEMGAGFHSTVWNGKDNLGKEVASGAYFYQMKTGSFTEVKKLTLLR